MTEAMVKALRIIQPIARQVREAGAARPRGIVEMPEIRSK